jgi:hypothetical protein
MKQEKLNKSGRFDKLYELLAQHEKYETACEVSHGSCTFSGKDDLIKLIGLEIFSTWRSA